MNKFIGVGQLALLISLTLLYSVFSETIQVFKIVSYKNLYFLLPSILVFALFFISLKNQNKYSRGAAYFAVLLILVSWWWYHILHSCNSGGGC